ncbi:MAG: winged helix-turn-helix transcriptional regulator [Candidatus Lokiarchaeota archaeon]|nr:winged helix-turn-helix transcriptional regulator [Candidatus Lokiarchaeota archaeon]
MDDIQKTALEARKEASFLLKAFSHPVRIEILAYLYNGVKEFPELSDKINLSKTALVKHLNMLMERGVIIRIERSKYEITQDGREVFFSIINAYRKTQMRFRSVQKQLWSQYMPKPQISERNDSNRFIVNFPAEYIPGWLSFNSCLTGVLNSLGNKYEKYQIGGHDGTAFFINVLKGYTCPSGPSNLCPMKDFYEGIRDLGWIVKEYYEFQSREVDESNHNNEKFERLFGKVKEILIDTNRPVILWGIPIPEYGVVNGFNKDEYIVSTFRRHAPEYFGMDDNIKYDEIITPGRFQMLYFEKGTEKLDQTSADINAIKRSIKMLGQDKSRAGYVTGPEAFKEWAKVLEGDIENVSYHGNSYVGICTLESVGLASQFLFDLSKSYSKTKEGALFNDTGSIYKQIQKLIQEFVHIFPFAFDGDLSKKKREKGAEILRKIHPKLSSVKKNLIAVNNIWD